MGPQRRMEIYVGYDSPTIISYLEPNMGDQFEVRPISSKDKIPWILKKGANESVDEGILDMVDPKVDKLKSYGRG
uniref:Uncharacterized protein n=1 Tax=Brassica oleracea var. oleracea TaxID=109376 RepID=A0A0D3ADN9_BRAOL